MAKAPAKPKPRAKAKPKDKAGAPLGNQNAIGNSGRPRKYTDPVEFNAVVDDYFLTCDADHKKPTLAGISLHLDFCDKETFGTYADVGLEFSRTINKARLRIEDNRHQLLVDRETFTPGVIFDLKNNHGWKDKQELELTGNIAALLAARRKARTNDQ